MANTVVVNFDMCNPRPGLHEVEKVIMSDMKLDIASVKGLQLHHTRNSVLISFKTLETAVQFVIANKSKHSIRCQTGNAVIPVYLEDGATDVLIHDLPLETPLREINRIMTEYGKVEFVRSDTWKKFFGGVDNGVRIARVCLDKPIPSYVKCTINDKQYVAYITYKNQVPTCRYCESVAHKGKTCLEASAKSVQRNTPATIQKTSQPAAKAASVTTESSATTSNPNTETAPTLSPAVSTFLAQTSTSNQTKAQQQPSMDMDSGEFTIVERKRVATTRNRPQAQPSSDDDNSEIQTGKDDAHLDVASPPRKQMITRSNKKNAAAPGTV